MKTNKIALQCLCGNQKFEKIFTYDGVTQGEIRFQFSLNKDYWREVHRCKVCGHFMDIHNLDDNDLYAGDYVDTTYGNMQGLRKTYEKIISLDPSRSDNSGRVRRILDFSNNYFPKARFANRAPKVLDVGSGLCVFLHKMKAEGWECVALDVDPRQAKHAQDVVGVQAFCGEFGMIPDLGLYDCVTFNKVLEHVQNPVAMLAKAAGHVQQGGFVYVEVPDGEAAIVEGQEREEFLLGHIHIFSLTSLSILAQQAGFVVRSIERVREPSTKFTLRAFLCLPESDEN